MIVGDQYEDLPDGPVDGETDAEWTDRLIREAPAGVRRQCSIGWHNECSYRDDDRCACQCHQRVEVHLSAAREMQANLDALIDHSTRSADQAGVADKALAELRSTIGLMIDIAEKANKAGEGN